MLLSHCEAFQNIVSPLEVMASLRAEARAQRKSKESCWSLDFGAEWNIEAAKPGTGQAIQQRKHLDNTHVNFNNMPRERGNATVDLLGFADAKQIEADCSSVNEIEVSFDRPRLKPKRTGKGREGEDQLDMSERIRRNALCEETNTASLKRRQARINKKRFGVYDIKQEKLYCSEKSVVFI